MITTLAAAAVFLAAGVGPYDTVLQSADEIMVFPENHAVLIGCMVCHNPESPGMDDFSTRTQGWSGCTDGRNEPHFIFKSEVSSEDADNALIEAGAVVYNNFSVPQAVDQFQNQEENWSHYLNGTKVMPAIRWEENGEIREVAYERFFREMSTGRNGEIQLEKEFTPHFVYHGSSLLNTDGLFGCLVCQQDCSGGLVCNNRGACCQPVPTLMPDWDLIPEPGTIVTLVIYVMPER